MNEEKPQDTIDSLSRQIVDVLHKELGDKCGSNRNFPCRPFVARRLPQIQSDVVRFARNRFRASLLYKRSTIIIG
ncbi:hypothetical protein AHX51_04045 [Salmonella enterica subsp. diarizonae]|nr:hypothetical protein [Salmonella enterica subsp. diarizonae]